MSILGGFIGDLIKPVSEIIDQVVVDKDKKAQAKVDLARLQIEMTDKLEQRVHEQMIAQTEINKVEASNTSLFVAGWRPAVGWIGATALGYSYILMPMASWAATVIWGYDGTFPAIDGDVILYILGGMLGFGGLRSFEKVKGVSTDVLQDSPAASKNVPTATVVPYKYPLAKGKPTSYSSIGIPDYTQVPEDAPWKK